MAQAVKQLVGNRPVEFYGYSGGALLSGLVIEKYPEIHVKKWITYAGLLNHKSWTEYHKLAPLTSSLDLDMLPSVLQMHYVGEKDRVIPPALSRQWTGGKNLVIVPNATHLGPFLQEK